jgi:MCP family monocarboxylic acid transporter-like MFS transporter 10
VIALFISTSLGNGKLITKNWGSLLDYRGFLDSRYSVLCVGAFLAQLGQWTPSYYISMSFLLLE